MCCSKDKNNDIIFCRETGKKCVRTIYCDQCPNYLRDECKGCGINYQPAITFYNNENIEDQE
jgi:hypothetical protein